MNGIKKRFKSPYWESETPKVLMGVMGLRRSMRVREFKLAYEVMSLNGLT